MEFWRELLGICFISLSTVLFAKSIMSDLADFYYNRSARKKINKASNFKDKLLYSKYKERIPKLFFIYYYVISVINPVTVILFIVFHQVSVLNHFAKPTHIALDTFNILCMLIPSILFWQKDVRAKGFKYDRWLKK